jgi:hypothetical protein
MAEGWWHPCQIGVAALNLIVEADELLNSLLRSDSLYPELLGHPSLCLFYAFDSFAALVDGPRQWAQNLSENERQERLLALRRLVESGALRCEPSHAYENARNAAHMIWYPGACWATLCLAIATKRPILTAKRQYRGIGLATWHPQRLQRLQRLLDCLPIGQAVGPPWLRCTKVSTFDERRVQPVQPSELLSEHQLHTNSELQHPTESGTEVSLVTISFIYAGTIILNAALKYFAAGDRSKKTSPPAPASSSTRRPVWTFLKFVAASVAFYVDVREDIRRRSVGNVVSLTPPAPASPGPA